MTDLEPSEQSAIRLTPAGTAALVRGSGRTLAEELRFQLADEIVRGTLAPGAALDETELARRFRVSRTPVREALRQLAASGLIESRAHRGCVVARPDHEHLIGMFEAMAELEALCAGLAAARITPAERHSLAAAPSRSPRRIAMTTRSCSTCDLASRPRLRNWARR